jgi:hypothetical protein
MKFTATVTLGNGQRIEAEVWPKDLVEFERRFSVPIARLGEEGRLEWVMFVAHQACSRSGRYAGDFEAFLDDVVGVDLAEEPPAPPTSPAA